MARNKHKDVRRTYTRSVSSVNLTSGTATIDMPGPRQVDGIEDVTAHCGDTALALEAESVSENSNGLVQVTVHGYNESGSQGAFQNSTQTASTVVVQAEGF